MEKTSYSTRAAKSSCKQNRWQPRSFRFRRFAERRLQDHDKPNSRRFQQRRYSRTDHRSGRRQILEAHRTNDPQHQTNLNSLQINPLHSMEQNRTSFRTRKTNPRKRKLLIKIQSWHATRSKTRQQHIVSNLRGQKGRCELGIGYDLTLGNPSGGKAMSSGLSGKQISQTENGIPELTKKDNITLLVDGTIEDKTRYDYISTTQSAKQSAICQTRTTAHSSSNSRQPSKPNHQN